MKLGDYTASLMSRGDKALVAFLTAGYPNPETFVELAVAADAAGADVIEIGIPFSDPIADGPVIQRASQKALEGGMTPAGALDLAARVARRADAPLVVMSYLNPVLSIGAERFAARASDSGIAGVIFPDVPLEESGGLRETMRASGIEYVDLIAPTTGDDRVERIAGAAGGFLYLVALTGVTGARTEHASGLEAFVERVRLRTRLPLYVGFGLSTVEQVRRASRVADGVIMGSRLLEIVDEGTGEVERLGSFIATLKRATRENGGDEPLLS